MNNKLWKNNNLLNEDYEDITDGLYTGPNPKIDILSGYKDIDGFQVSTEGAYTPTSQLMHDWYSIFNKKYFKKKLPDLDISQFPVRNVRGWVGLTEARVLRASRGSNKLKWAVIEAVDISIRYERTESVYLNTLLHEMIHVYQYTVLKVCGDHNETFIDKMNELNNIGWNIAVVETDEERDSRGSINKSTLDKISNSKYFGVIKQKNNKMLAFIFPKKNFDLFQDKIDKYHYKAKVYEILNPEPFVDWESTTMRSSLSGYKTTEDEVKEMEDKMIIKDFWKTESYKMNESVEKPIEKYDPMVSSQVIKTFPDGTVLEEVSII